jgi:hypothetical protein
MTLTLAPVRLSRSDTYDRLVRFAGCATVSGGEDGKTARVVADFLRHGVCHLGSDEGAKSQAVHVHQLLSALRRELSGWMLEPDLPPWVSQEEASRSAEDEEPDAAVHMGVKDHGLHLLRKLQLIGDCGHRGAGYYLATPIRVICLPFGSAVVVGSLPTSELAEVLGVQPVWAGLARAVPADKVSYLRDGVVRQNFASWSGVPTESLEAWTRRLLEEAIKKAVSTAGFDTTMFEVYAPHLQPGQGQRYRWGSPRAWRRDPRTADESWFLCRTRARPYRFWLAPLIEDTQGARFRREWSVRPQWARRLLYGIDHLSGHPVAARVFPVSGGLTGEREVRLYNWPAWEEYQVLSALAYDFTPPEGPYLPLRFRVAGAWWPDVRSQLAGLGIRIPEQS